MQKILITGSNGLLGQKLVKLLADTCDYDFLATSKGENRIATLYPQMKYLSMDISSEREVNQIFENYKPDFLIHTAAMTNVDECETSREMCWKLNVEAIEHLSKNCEKHNTHFVHLSTDFIFDGTKEPYKEEDVPNPLSFYGESKLTAEKIVMNSQCKWAILRTVLVYGISYDMSRSNIVLWVKNSLENKKAIKVVNDQWRTPTLAEDLAMGCYLAVKHKAEGVFNISGKDLLTPYEMAIKTAKYFELDESLIEEVDGSVFTQIAKRPPKTGFVIDKAIKMLGYNPHSFDEGIAILAEQIREK